MNLIIKALVVMMIIMLSYNIVCLSKENKMYFWVPVKYLDELKKKNTSKDDFTSLKVPIEGIIYNNGKLSISTTNQGEFDDYRYKIIKKNPLTLKVKGPLYFITVSALRNRNILDSIFEHTDIYLKFVQDYLEVILKTNHKYDTIKFTKYLYGNRIIENNFIDIYQLKMSGKFDIYDSSGKLIEANITINPNNNIVNSNIFKSYSLDISEPYVVQEESGYIFEPVLAKIIKQNNEIILLLIFIKDNNDMILCTYKKHLNFTYIKKDIIYTLKFKEPYDF